MSVKEHRRAALYIRQSKFHDGSISEELQETATRKLCAANDWEVVEVYRDIDISGRSTTNRPGLRDLRDSFDRGEFDIAVAHAASRFARNMADGADIVGSMPIATVLEGEAPADDDFMPLLHMLLAHKQAKEISKRWREVQARRTAQGKPKDGTARFGYEYDRAAKEYRRDPVTGPILRELYLRFMAGRGFVGLAHELNARGVKTTRGNDWRLSTLSRGLDSGFGAGLILVKTKDGRALASDDYEFLQGSHEPVITMDEWRRYQRVRESRRQRPAKARSPRWFLAGIVVCGRCGVPVMVGSHKAQYPQVICATYKNHGKARCEGIHYMRDHIENQVAVWLGGHVEAWAAAVPDNSAERLELEGRLEALDASLADLDQRAGKLTSGWASGLLDDTGYRLAVASLDEQRAALGAERESAQATLDDLDPGTDVYDRIMKGSEGLESDEWNAVLRKVIARVEVHPDELRIVDHHGTVTPLARLRRPRPPQKRLETGRFA